MEGFKGDLKRKGGVNEESREGEAEVREERSKEKKGECEVMGGA